MMSADQPPVVALAQFFDDVRIEVTGKSILIGQYSGDLFLHPSSPFSVDRLTVLLTAGWPRDYLPKACGVRIDIPAQQPVKQQFPLPKEPDFTGKPLSPFAGVTIQGIIMLRFAPLRIGDAIDVWFLADDCEIPAGRLRISDASAVSAMAAAAPATGAPTPIAF